MEVKSGDFLEDIDIEITIRSSKADLVILQKLMKAIVASSTSLIDTEVALIETNINIKSVASKKLTSLAYKLQI